MNIVYSLVVFLVSMCVGFSASARQVEGKYRSDGFRGVLEAYLVHSAGIEDNNLEELTVIIGDFLRSESVHDTQESGRQNLYDFMSSSPGLTHARDGLLSVRSANIDSNFPLSYVLDPSTAISIMDWLVKSYLLESAFEMNELMNLRVSDPQTEKLIVWRQEVAAGFMKELSGIYTIESLKKNAAISALKASGFALMTLGGIYAATTTGAPILPFVIVTFGFLATGHATEAYHNIKMLSTPDFKNQSARLVMSQIGRVQKGIEIQVR